MRQTHSFSHTLRFTFSAGTSRGVMTTRPTHYLVLEQNGRRGVGECAPLAGLSEDDVPNLPMMIDLVRQRLEKRPVPRSAQEAFQWVQDAVPANLPSVRFGAETALLDLLHGGRRLLFPSVMHPDFTPVPINGLVWMGDPAFMQQQIDDKLEQGFRCIKLKIGAIDFSKELRLLQGIRKRYSRDMVSLRVDANGAFSPAKAMDKLKRLAKLNVHSIEQPIAPGQPEAMAALCRNSPVPIALDEELIGVHTSKRASPTAGYDPAPVHYPKAYPAGRTGRRRRLGNAGRKPRHRMVGYLGPGVERGPQRHRAVGKLVRTHRAAGAGHRAVVPQ